MARRARGGLSSTSGKRRPTRPALALAGPTQDGASTSRGRSSSNILGKGRAQAWYGCPALVWRYCSTHASVSGSSLSVTDNGIERNLSAWTPSASPRLRTTTLSAHQHPVPLPKSVLVTDAPSSATCTCPVLSATLSSSPTMPTSTTTPGSTQSASSSRRTARADPISHRFPRSQRKAAADPDPANGSAGYSAHLTVLLA